MLSILFASTQSQACISLVPRSCVQGDAWTETNGWHTPECILRKSSEVPPGLRSKTVQLYGWNLCYVIWAENQLWLIFIAAVNEAIKLQRGTAEFPEVCTASEEALNNPFACVPLWKGKHSLKSYSALGCLQGLSFHLKSIFPDSVLRIWQLIKISSILMCVTSKNTNCRLKSVLHWTGGTEVFHYNSSIYFEYVKGLGAINC